MEQLYFLSILCNFLTGYILFCGDDSRFENTLVPVNNPTFILVLGILSIVTGILKLLAPMKEFVIIGDFIPASSGVIAGIILIFGMYRQNTSSKTGELDRFGVSLLAFRKPIGLALFAVAIIHFLFPHALFL
ncbi:MAG: hypothetical protein FWD47_01945 [Treponema sp.]|nr:hypothetical protein [Treponema sp.]